MAVPFQSCSGSSVGDACAVFPNSKFFSPLLVLRFGRFSERNGARGGVVLTRPWGDRRSTSLGRRGTGRKKTRWPATPATLPACGPLPIPIPWYSTKKYKKTIKKKKNPPSHNEKPTDTKAATDSPLQAQTLTRIRASGPRSRLPMWRPIPRLHGEPDASDWGPGAKSESREQKWNRIGWVLVRTSRGNGCPGGRVAAALDRLDAGRGTAWLQGLASAGSFGGLLSILCCELPSQRI